MVKSRYVGLAEIAEKERRVLAMRFRQWQDCVDYEDEFQIGQRSPDKVIKIASEFIGSGTILSNRYNGQWIN